MIGILIIAHENLGESFIRCASHVMGGQPKCMQCLNISIEDDPDQVLSKAQAHTNELDCGEGVLVFSDIYGATPCNIASRLIQPGKVECLAGLNLPMLVRALTYRNEPLDVVISRALTGGKEGVRHIHLEL